MMQNEKKATGQGGDKETSNRPGKDTPIIRDSFVFYRSFFEAIKNFPDPEKTEIIVAIISYGLDGEIPSFSNPYLWGIFSIVQPIIDSNNKRYLNGLKGAEHGKKGGRPKTGKTPKKPLKKPKETPNVNVNVNENENENEQERKHNPQSLDFIKSKPNIPTKNEVLEAFKANGGTLEMAAKFFYKHDAVGWYMNASPIRNWRALIGGFITNWRKNENKGKNGTVQYDKRNESEEIRKETAQRSREWAEWGSGIGIITHQENENENNT